MWYVRGLLSVAPMEWFPLELVLRLSAFCLCHNFSYVKFTWNSFSHSICLCINIKNTHINAILDFDREIKQTGWNREPDQDPKHLELIYKWKYTEPSPGMAGFICIPTLCSTLSHTYFPLVLSFSLSMGEPHNGGFDFVLCLSQNPHMVEKPLFSFRM